MSKCIVLFDVKSMYPSIVIGENISPEMKIVQEVMGERVVKFRKDEVGLIPKVIRLALDQRDKYRDLRLKVDTDELRKKYAGMEKSAKVGANATYGVLLFKGFRLYDKDCADAITRAGRRIIRRLYARLLDENIEDLVLREIIEDVLYGDTDSIFILLNCKWNEYEVDEEGVLVHDSGMPINRINDYLQEVLQEYCTELNYTEEVEGKVEAVFERIVFKYRLAKKEERKFAELVGGKLVVGAKKKYAALLRWKEGKGKCHEHYIKGFGRSDVSEYTKRVYAEVWRSLLDEGSVDRAIRVLRESWVGIRQANWYDISVPRGVKGNFDEYQEDAKRGGHIGATLFMIENCGIEFNPLIKPRTVCVRPKTGIQDRKIPIPKRIALLNGNEDPPKVVERELEIDFDAQAETILKRPFELLVYSLGRQWSEVETGTRQTTLDVAFAKSEQESSERENDRKKLDDKLELEFANLVDRS